VFVDPDVPDSVGVLTYGAHPRLMPTINQAEPRILNNTGKKVYPMPYKLSKIKRSAEILLIADGTLAQISEVSTPALQSNATLYGLDHGAWNGGPPAAGIPRSYLLDDYSISGMLPDYGPNTPVDIGYGNSPTVTRVNFDPTSPSNTFPANWGNLRFRHMNNSVANVLMADGHVELHRYKFGEGKGTSTLKRLNVNVNPQ
jgi:prepilin-type processing-associated H-X9-DG protein